MYFNSEVWQDNCVHQNRLKIIESIYCTLINMPSKNQSHQQPDHISLRE